MTEVASATRHVAYRPSYGPLRTCRDLYVGIEGNRGTSKTRSILTELVTRSLEYPGSRIVLAREHREDLTETVLVTLEDEVLPCFGMNVPGNQSREGRTVYDMPNGSQFIPIGIRDIGKSQSFKCTFAYVNEATETTKTRLTALTGAMRFLRDSEHPTLPTWNQLIFDVNPVDPNSWCNRWMEDVDNDIRFVKTREEYARLQKHNWKKARDPRRRPKRIITRHMDNPGYWDWDAWNYTPIGSRYIEETLGSLTGFMRERWLNGLWTAAEGSVYADAFSNVDRPGKKSNIIAPFRIPKHWPVWVYADPGEDHPWAVGWFTISLTGRKMLIGEIHARKLGGVANVAVLIKEKNAALGIDPIGYYLDPRHGFSSTAQSTATIAEQFAGFGLPNFMPAPRFQGKGYYASVEKVRTQFKSGNLLFFSDCVGFIADHQSWSYKRRPDGSIPVGDDAYELVNDDGCDCTRWFVNGGHSRDDVKAPPTEEQELQLYLRQLEDANPETISRD